MSNPIKAVCLIVLLSLSMQACDININMSDAPSIPPIALTITAQAAILQQGAQQPVNPANVNPPVANVNPPAQGNQNLPSEMPTNTPVPANAAVAATNTLAPNGPVTAKVTVETNCRSGPGLIYNSVYSMSASDVAEVIGKNTLTNYWIIKIPNGGGGICWLWGKYAVVTGNTASLVEYATPTPKATATNVPPTVTLTFTKAAAPASVAPSNLQVTNKTCSDQGNGKTRYTGTIAWTDNSNDELGFSITMPGFADTVGANVTTYNFDVNLFNVSYAMGTTITVEVTELSQTSTAASHVTFSCP